MNAVRLNVAQLAAREAFKNAILDETSARYADRVAIIPALDLDADTFVRTVGEHMSSGVCVVFVREDGNEMLIEPAARQGVRGWFDRRLGRMLLHVTYRGEANTPVEQEHTVHLSRGDELKRLVANDLCPV